MVYSITIVKSMDAAKDGGLSLFICIKDRQNKRKMNANISCGNLAYGRTKWNQQKYSPASFSNAVAIMGK